jgi:hypothetical protein
MAVVLLAHRRRLGTQNNEKTALSFIMAGEGRIANTEAPPLTFR